MKILFVQFANSMFLRHEACDGYWDAFYTTNNDIGYWRGKYTFEVPQWVAFYDYCIDASKHNREMFYCKKNIQEAIDKIKQSNYDYVLMSLMDCNKDFIFEIVANCAKTSFIIGGYNNDYLKYLGKTYPNANIVNTIEEGTKVMGVEYKFGTKYELFHNETVLPRLTLSNGCYNNCKFCTIPHGKVTPICNDAIYQQIESFKDLKFKLIYIDDKTFGQCENYTILKDLTAKIKEYNNDFEGYVVQTTSMELLRKYETFEEIGVKVAEIGMETWNDTILSLYRKPSNEKLVQECIDMCLSKGTIKLILNVIVGFPEEDGTTYEHTLKNVTESLKRGVLGINPAIYTDYSNKDSKGEIDFQESDKVELHRKYWEIINNTAKDILYERLNK